MIPDKRRESGSRAGPRRSHKATLLVDDDRLEWLTNIPTSKVDAVAYLRAEAVLADDPFMNAYLDSYLRLLAAQGGERASLIKDALVVQQPIGMIAGGDGKGGDGDG